LAIVYHRSISGVKKARLKWSSSSGHSAKIEV